MKLYLVTLAMILFPQWAPAYVSNSQDMSKERSERSDTKKSATQETQTKGLSPIPCPVAPQARDTHLNNLAKLENHSTTCPEGGALLHKDQNTTTVR